MGLFLSLDLCKDCVLTCARNVQKAQSRKWCKSINTSRTGTRNWVSCVRGKYANHLHHMGLMMPRPKLFIYIYYIYIQTSFTILPIILHTFDLVLPMLFKHLKLIENMFYYYLRCFCIKKKAQNILWGEATTHGTYIAPKDLLTPETERSLSQCGGVTFSQIILSLQ